MSNRIIIGLIFVMSSMVTMAANFTASVNKTTVAVGETFNITFSITINTSVSDFKAPAFTDFKVIGSPEQYQEQSIQGTNAGFSHVVIITLVYHLKPISEGEFTIPPASVNADGKTLTSNSIKIKVVKATAIPNQSQQQQNNQPQSSNSLTEEESDYFLRAIVDKSTLYQGEQLSVTFKFYSKKKPLSWDPEKLPEFDGFWTKDLEIGQTSLSSENVNGQNYYVGTIKKTILFPQRSGLLEISPFEIGLFIIEKVKPRNIFEQMRGYGEKEVKAALKSKPLKITVNPLPEPKPADFSGIVGTISLKDNIDKTDLKTNDAINLSVTISGSGNLNLIDAPKFSFPTDFEVYDPKIKDNITTGNNGVSGSRTYNYLLIPRHPGDFEIPVVSLSYFDPAKKSYVTLQTQKYSIHVEKGEGYEAGGATSTFQNKEDIKYLGSDIRFIKITPFPLKKKEEHFYRSTAFYVLLVIQILAFIGFMFTRQWQIKNNSNITLKRSREAAKMAKKHLSKAQHYLKENKQEQFYEELFTALWGFVGDKLGIPVSQLNKEVVVEKLQKQQLKEETIKQLIDTIQTCEFARFAPGGSAQQESIYNDALNIIMKVSEEVK